MTMSPVTVLHSSTHGAVRSSYFRVQAWHTIIIIIIITQNDNVCAAIVMAQPLRKGNIAQHRTATDRGPDQAIRHPCDRSAAPIDSK